jgi:hypothetical protein
MVIHYVLSLCIFPHIYMCFFFIVLIFLHLGLLIRTRQPRITELSGPIDIKTYRNRKGCFGILVLAGCDTNCAFTFFTCRHPGSTNDAWAITESEGGGILMGDSLPAEATSAPSKLGIHNPQKPCLERNPRMIALN